MAERVQVGCSTKSQGQVTGIGGAGWYRIERDAIADIESGRIEYFVRLAGWQDVKVIVGHRDGRKYLKTEADTTTTNNLMTLPNCPSR
jgi:hypothetical protein